MTQVQHRTFVQTTHGDTHYVLEGAIHDKTAPLIVMVHGLGAGVFFFHFLAAFLVLTGGYRVLRIDRYGSGHSSVASAPHDGDLFVDQIKELLDKLNLNDSKLTFIGHSMGGAIACLFAAKHPEKIESLILLSPAGMRWYIFGIFILRWFPTVCRWILRKLTPVFLSRFVPLTFYDPDYASKGVKHFENSIKEAGFEHFADTMFQSIVDFPLNNCEEEVVQVSKLDVPVLLIWGQHDHTVPADKCFPQWYEAFKHNPRAEFYVIKNVRHDFPAEEVELTNFLVLQFLQAKKPTEKELERVKRNRSANDIQTGFRDKSTTRFWRNSKYNKFLI